MLQLSMNIMLDLPLELDEIAQIHNDVYPVSFLLRFLLRVDSKKGGGL